MIEILDENAERPPYFQDEFEEEGFLVRETNAISCWMRFQAGKKVIEKRCYPCKAMNGRGFDEFVVVYHLLGYGETEDEAINMARKNTYGKENIKTE